jgi:hypothetical protein
MLQREQHELQYNNANLVIMKKSANFVSILRVVVAVGVQKYDTFVKIILSESKI